MKKLLMKLQRLIALLFLLTTCGFALPAHARWVVDRYEVNDDSTQQSHERPDNLDQEKVYYHVNAGHASTPAAPRIYSQPAYTWGGPTEVGSSARLKYVGRNTTLKAGSARLKLTVTPVFKWLDGGQSGTPPNEIYYRERCSSETNRAHYSHDDPQNVDYMWSEYNFNNPYDGRFLEVAITKPEWWKKSSTEYTSRYPEYNSLVSQDDQWIVHKIHANGTEQRGRTHTFTGEITSSGVTLGREYSYDTSHSPPMVSGSILLHYQAEIVHFSLNVGAGGEFTRSLDKPRDKKIDAYAGKNWLGKTNSEAAVHFFWDGQANYAANISSELRDTIGNPTYKWETGTTYTTNQIENGRTESDRDADNENELPGESTPTKSLHHEASDESKWEGPTTTTTELTVEGDNEQKSTLTAKAKIDWYAAPTTRYRSEVVTEVYNYETGTSTPLNQLLEANPLEVEEDRYVDEFTAEYEAMEKEFVETGATSIGLALEGEMMVGSWFVPDEMDVATAGLTLAGRPIRKLFKVAKATRTAVEIGQKINKVRDKLTPLLAIIKKRPGNESILLVVRRKIFREGRLGHVGSDGARIEAPMGELKEESQILCTVGDACFKRGTLVSTERGLRVIETIQKDDKVWSRDQKTGKTQLKRVKQTFERQSATLLLTFSNGEKIETTKEHPFYIESQGFKAAGELGIGTSIVTRAGPGVTLASTSVGEAQTVYNFEVEDFHTYFVGKSEVWVHNQCVPRWSSLPPGEEGTAISSTLSHINNGTMPPTIQPYRQPKWGSNYGNREGHLPGHDATGNSITYKEYDVDNAPGSNYPGPRRIAVGSDGTMFYTFNHYGGSASPGQAPFVRIN